MRNEGRVMDVSLQQAIEIHARSMEFRFGSKSARRRACQKAMRCREGGDLEGFAVWMRVRDAIAEDNAPPHKPYWIH